MQELDTVIISIEKRVSGLVEQLTDLKAENDVLQSSNAELRLMFDNEKKRAKDLEEQNKVTKIAKSVTLSDDDRKVQRRRLNDMVREIDKCIALINS